MSACEESSAKLSHALLAEYRKKQVIVLTAEKVKLETKLSNPSRLMNDCTFVGMDEEFFTPLGNLFKTCVMNAFDSMQSYVDPIVTKHQLQPWKEKAKRFFLHLWSALSKWNQRELWPR